MKLLMPDGMRDGVGPSCFGHAAQPSPWNARVRIVVFAAFGMWKAPSEEQAGGRREDPAIIVPGVEYRRATRTFLSPFAVFGMASLVHAPIGMGLSHGP